MTALSEVMKKRRKDLGLTLAQVADAVGVTEATAQRWESGNIKSVRHEKITQLASVLNVNPAELMGWQASIDYPKNTHPMPEMRKIPLVGTIACGTPILADQNIEEGDEIVLPPSRALWPGGGLVMLWVFPSGFFRAGCQNRRTPPWR